MRRKDGRSQRWALANNLAANAANMVKAVHFGANNAASAAATSRACRRAPCGAVYRQGYQTLKIFRRIVAAGPILMAQKHLITSMRSLLILFFLSAFVAGAACAQVETRIFIVSSHANDYRAVKCPTDHEKCGEAMAAAYCKSRDYARAISYRKIPRQEITGGVPAASACNGGICEEFVAIECGR
jgi:hypothetical protein